MKTTFLTALLIACSLYSFAQFPYTETFQNSTAPGVTIAGAAKLTAATGTDPEGQGYLRLTDNGSFSIGYAYCQQSFPSTYGMTASFEYFLWKPDALGYNQADGISFFLFDASNNAFRPGGTGGSLGYANYYTTPGLAKGYMGVALDVFGNFSATTDGNKNGGPGRRAGSVVIRGPGNGTATTDYVYQAGVTASDPAYNAGFLGFTQRYPATTQANYRKIQIILTPGSSAGLTVGYTVTVKMIKGGSPTTTVTLINNLDYPYAAPANLKFGVSGSTGSIYNYQEIRNMTITTTNPVLPPVLLPDGAAICSGTAYIDVLNNDASLNAGGHMVASTIDLDPLTAGLQSTYTDAGKGTYTVNASGSVAFTAVPGYMGASIIAYTVKDSYGASPLAASAITVTVNPALAPSLTIADPAAVCAPSTINITSAAYKTATTSGASYNYFSTLSDANLNISNINSSATAIATSGTYYIRASLLGCVTVRPINVQVSAAPSTSNAGVDISSCSSTGGYNATLLATNPATGTGAWTQVSGTNTVPVNFPSSAMTPVLNMPQGIYTYRWTVSNGACAASADDIVITVGVPSNAGTTQNISNATTATLAANTAAPATGAWTKTAGPGVTITNAALAGTTITGLVPGNSYTMQWRVTNGACSNTSTVVINNVLNTVAYAGPDQIISINTGALAGNTADAGNIGTWTLISGPSGHVATIAQPNNPASAISGLTKSGDYIVRWTMVNGLFSNSDDMKFTVLGLLPVQLVSFTATPRGEYNLLQWQTASEERSAYYSVERSFDAVNFSRIGVVNAAGNSSALTHYQFRDEERKPDMNIIYYRLQCVDTDGKSRYSSIAKVNIATTARFTISPNPFIDHVKISIDADAEVLSSIVIYNSSGQPLRRMQSLLKKGMNTIEVKELNTLPAGVYSIVADVKGKLVKKTVVKM